jgi:hypothetical protein
MSIWTIRWILVALLALDLEFIAVVSGEKDATLSEQIWIFLGIGQKNKGPVLLLRWGTLVMLFVLAGLHFFFGIS